MSSKEDKPALKSPIGVLGMKKKRQRKLEDIPSQSLSARDSERPMDNRMRSKTANFESDRRNVPKGPPTSGSALPFMKEGPPITLEVLTCLIEFLNHEKNMKINGIFRITGSRKLIDELHMSLTGVVDLGGFSPVTVAAVLKKYLRLSPVPLLPFQCYETLIMIQQIAQPSDRLKALLEYFGRGDVPDESKKYLDVLVPYLQRVSSHSAENQMDLPNLARMFAPSFIRTPPNAPFTDVNAANAEILTTKDLLMHYGYIMRYTGDVNFESLNMAWKRKTKRKTMALMAKAEVPEKFLLIDNSRGIKVEKAKLPTRSNSDDEEDSPNERRKTASFGKEVISGPTEKEKKEEKPEKEGGGSKILKEGEKRKKRPRRRLSLKGNEKKEEKPKEREKEEEKKLSASGDTGQIQQLMMFPGKGAGSTVEKLSSSEPNVQPQRATEVRENWNPFSTSLEISFGEMHVTRKHSDIRILHYFLIKNYSHIRFPNVPSKEFSKKDPSGAREEFEKFLAFVCTQDELFMDALFTKRWLEFLGQTKSKKEKGKEKDREREIVSGSSSDKWKNPSTTKRKTIFMGTKKSEPSDTIGEYSFDHQPHTTNSGGRFGIPSPRKRSEK